MSYCQMFDLNEATMSVSYAQKPVFFKFAAFTLNLGSFSTLYFVRIYVNDVILDIF